MFLGGNLTDEIPGEVLGGGFFNPGWPHVEDEEVWLDVANPTHVRPEVWSTASRQSRICSPLVEFFWGFVAGGIDLICLEEVHSRIASIVGLSGMPPSERHS